MLGAAKFQAQAAGQYKIQARLLRVSNTRRKQGVTCRALPDQFWPRPTRNPNPIAWYFDEPWQDALKDQHMCIATEVWRLKCSRVLPGTMSAASQEWDVLVVCGSTVLWL